MIGAAPTTVSPQFNARPAATAATPAAPHSFLRLIPPGIPRRGFRAVISTSSPSHDVMIISFLSRG